jgi:hypothetical protein
MRRIPSLCYGMLRAHSAALVSLVPAAGFVWGCATLGEAAGGDSNLPSSGVGPFRKLASGEVLGSAPYVLDDSAAQYREPSAIVLADGSDALYVVLHATTGHDVIVRSRATDARTFYGATEDIGHTPPQVLASDQSWEGPDLSYPSALVVGSSVWVYYVSGGAVGLAQSTDGLTFTKMGAPVLPADSTPILSASVAQLPDGTFDMMFAQGFAIYEATSVDGMSWQRSSSTDPVLAPMPGEVAVLDPCLAPRVTAAARVQVRVLFASQSFADGGLTSYIGFAARYGSSGPLTRSPEPAYSVNKHERAPAFLPLGALSYLYVQEDSQDGTYPSIAAAIAPANATLPTPSTYPSSP